MLSSVREKTFQRQSDLYCRLLRAPYRNAFDMRTWTQALVLESTTQSLPRKLDLRSRVCISSSCRCTRSLLDRPSGAEKHCACCFSGENSVRHRTKPLPVAPQLQTVELNIGTVANRLVSPSRRGSRYRDRLIDGIQGGPLSRQQWIDTLGARARFARILIKRAYR
jgi:hypothetical protein